MIAALTAPALIASLAAREVAVRAVSEPEKNADRMISASTAPAKMPGRASGAQEVETTPPALP